MANKRRETMWAIERPSTRNGDGKIVAKYFGFHRTKAGALLNFVGDAPWYYRRGYRCIRVTVTPIQSSR